MKPAAPANYKYPDGIVLTLKTANHTDHYFVERTFAVQLANSIKESLFAKREKPKAKPTENKPAKLKKKDIKEKTRAD